MKPRPQVSMQCVIVSGPHSMLTPRAASTSAEPEREEIDRLPCLATGTPAPATTKAAQVEILCVPLASPPVPQVSMAPSGARTLTARARMARAAPAISSTVSPRARIPISNAPTCTSVAAPDMISAKISAASFSVNVSPAAILRRAGRRSTSVAVLARPGLEGTGRFSLRRSAGAPLDAGKVEKVGKQLMTMLRGDALGMELHPVHGIARMLEAHDHAICRLRGDLQSLRQACALDHERMVARGGEVLRGAV